MRNYEQIDSYIREARLQRSAYVGTLIGEWLGDLWLAGARIATKAAEAPSQPVPATARVLGPAPSR